MDYIITGNDSFLDRVEIAERHLVGMIRPAYFRSDDPNRLPITSEMDISFEKAASALEEAGFSNPKNLTIFEWNVRLDYLKEKRPKEND